MKARFNIDDERYMHLALSLAKKGMGKVSPNPQVGCAIVRDGVVVGRGYHEYFGGPHAEINALNNAGTLAEGSTMYVTLEPCDHTGKTPPCTRAIVAAKIKRVVVATLDPDVKVRGRGARKLREHSIQVDVGLLQGQAEKLNGEYVNLRRSHRAFVMVKAAMSADGKIATRTGDSKWISSAKSRAWVHTLRSNVDAVIIGRGTAVRDNPHLTSHGAGQNPVRVILDPNLKTPLERCVFDGQAPTIVFYSKGVDDSKIGSLRRKKVMVIPLSGRNGSFNMKHVVSILNRFSLYRILIEGGGETIASAFEARVVTDLALFVAPSIIGGREAKSPVEGNGIGRVNDAIKLTNVKVKRMRDDILLSAKVQYD